MRFRTNKTLSMILAIFLIAMLVFTGCTPAQDNPQNDEQNDNQDVVQQASLQLSLEEYPRMDGSTANLPMMAEIMSQVCGITLEEAEELTTCTKTSNAWSNVANGNADILLVYEAAEDTKAYLETVGTELEVTPVGRDALVFINNEQNPVDNLTQAQLIDIYTGKVTNWNEVGGEDLDIIPYQRVVTSGSQSLFMKLLMKDVVPMDAPMELRPAEMGMLIDELARYNNEGNALGYSVFYYASYMYQQPGLRMIAVDGVQPSDETIADGSYPLL
ncbi:MAG: substrate-binding domain-containing protein, partial [Peptococcaceae bacterium]|nr:substrate-binding domain-containing protein [Peptococcaceae bacterium]